MSQQSKFIIAQPKLYWAFSIELVMLQDLWTVGMALVHEPVELNAGGQVIYRAPLKDRELARVLEDLLDEGMHISPVDYTGKLKV